MKAKVRVTRAMVVLFDDRENEIFRGHVPVHREVVAGEEMTLLVRFATHEVPDDGS